MSPQQPDSLSQALGAWRRRAADWLATGGARGPAESGAGPGDPAAAPAVVVVGETNRGKSALVNALLDRPGLSPVDAGSATCSYLRFRWSPEPTATAHFGGGLADVRIGVDRLAEWATVAGDGDPDLPPPRWIDVGLPVPVLRSVALVDTPGVGGLVAAHAELAAEAAAAATAVLFVVDASAPLTRPEVDFLVSVGDRVDTVGFAVTKIDAFRGWQQIVRDDRDLLARHAPRFVDAPFFPVSARLAGAGAGQPDPAVAALLADRAGVAALRAFLVDEVGARAEVLRQANQLRGTMAVVRGELAASSQTRQSLVAGPDGGQDLRARREELLARRRASGRAWQVTLRAELQRAKVDMAHETAREVREAGQRFRAAIDAADAAELKAMPFHIDAYAQAMTMRAHRRLVEATSRICHAALAALFTDAERARLLGELQVRPYLPVPAAAPGRARSVDDTIMTLGGAGVGFTVSRLATLLPAAALPAALGVVLMPVSLVLGGAAAWLMVRSRRRVADRQHLKQWLVEVLGTAKAQIDQDVAEQFIAADAQLTLALDGALQRQADALDAQIREVDVALKLDAVARAARVRELDDRRDAGGALVVSGELLLDRVRGAPEVEAPAPRRGRHAAIEPADPTAPATRRILLPPGLPGAPPRSVLIPAVLPSRPAPAARSGDVAGGNGDR